MPCRTPGATARAGGAAGVGGGAGVAAVLLPFTSHFSCTLAPRVEGESPLCALLISESKYNTSRGRALPLLVLVRPGAAAGSALLKLLPLAPGSCRPRGAHTPALGSVPPAGFVAPAASIRGAGLGSGAEEPPPAPVFASLPGGAGPGPELSWALSRGVSTREGPGASPRGIGAGPAPAATSLQGACKRAATAPIPRASPEGGCGARPSWGQPPGWVCGAGCVPGALPLGWGRLGWVEGAHQDQSAAASLP